MFARLLKLPSDSFFLLGPRGCGKSSWLKQTIKSELTYDLLSNEDYLRLTQHPSILYKECEILKKNSWVVIDEAQRIPELLDEVHRLIEERQIKFALCGSSARKLKKAGVNLLAGRAVTINMFPFVAKEVGFDCKIENCIRFGMLPKVVTSEDPQDYLSSYVNTYLREEIRQEALVRNIGGFARFLEIAARQVGQRTNFTNIGSDAGVSRHVVAGFFEILVDTLIGFWLPAWELRRSTKQVSHPKFYFFDSGVARALSGRLAYPPTTEEQGPLFETFILNEIKAYLSYQKKRYELFYWSSYDQVEVDVLLEDQTGHIGIEIKNSSKWQTKFERGLKRISEEIGKSKMRCYGVFTGPKSLISNGIKVLTWKDFLQELWNGNIVK